MELLASNPELDINSYERFIAREHNLDEASVEGIKSSLETCRRHLKIMLKPSCWTAWSLGSVTRQIQTRK